MKIRIREASSKDFQQVLRLSRDMYNEAKTDPNFGDYVYVRTPSVSTWRGWFTERVRGSERGDCVYMVAEADKRIVGQCFVKRKMPGSELAHVGELSILVNKRYRNAGVGTTLLKSMLKKCRGRFEIVTLDVFRTNEKAKRLYKRLGFKTFGVGKGFVKRGKKHIDQEYMYLDIKNRS